ncbi:MAG: stage II sporulation protein R [Clostridia bacterium]|nr:stage II sporulation protein R [Clostridia bacterium]
MRGRRFCVGMIASICAVAAGLLMGPGAREVEAAVWQGDMIRLHVVAHSDSEEDQRTKLAVRDALLEAFGAELQADSYATAIAAIEERLPDIRRVAQSAALARGEAGGVRVDFGLFPFPARMYGDTAVPAGSYRALRVTIGEGAGRNWWCVVYPALCLADADCTPTAQQAMPLPGAEPQPQPAFTGALWNWIEALLYQ